MFMLVNKNHAHVVELDDDKNGVSSWTYGHRHEVIDGLIQRADYHLYSDYDHEDNHTHHAYSCSEKREGSKKLLKFLNACKDFSGEKEVRREMVKYLKACKDFFGESEEKCEYF